MAALDAETRELIAKRRQFGTVELSPIDIERQGRVVAIGGERFVEHVAEVGRLGGRSISCPRITMFGSAAG